MRNYEGTFRIRFNSEKPQRGVYIERGVSTSTLTAADVNRALELMMEHAAKNKCGIDRWSLYIPEINDNMKPEETQVPVSKVKAFLKDPSKEVRLVAANWGKPRINIVGKVTSTKKQSSIIDIA